MRTSMGPSCGGFTCTFALVKLLPTINDTRSARPCANSGVSTAGETFRVGAAVASVPAVVLALNCATPSPPVSGREESAAPARECLSAGPILASAETACAPATAAGLETGTGTGMGARAGAAASWVGLDEAVAGESSDDEDASVP